MDAIRKTTMNDFCNLYQVDEVFNSIDEMFENPRVIEMYTMYENHIETKKKLLSGRKCFKGYRIGDKILYEILLDEGFKVLNELQLGASLDSGALSTYLANDHAIMIVRAKYDNTPQNRRLFAQSNINITKVYL